MHILIYSKLYLADIWYWLKSTQKQAHCICWVSNIKSAFMFKKQQRQYLHKSRPSHTLPWNQLNRLQPTVHLQITALLQGRYSLLLLSNLTLSMLFVWHEKKKNCFMFLRLTRFFEILVSVQLCPQSLSYTQFKQAKQQGNMQSLIYWTISNDKKSVSDKCITEWDIASCRFIPKSKICFLSCQWKHKGKHRRSKEKPYFFLTSLSHMHEVHPSFPKLRKVCGVCFDRYEYIPPIIKQSLD